MSELPKRDAKDLIRDLRQRAAMLTGQSWERSANKDMMNEAAQMLEDMMPSASNPHTWTGLMAGFAPADMDFSTTNSGDVGGPVSEKP